MSIRTIIDGGLHYLTKRRTDNITKKSRYPPTKTVEPVYNKRNELVCGSCGGVIVKVNDKGTHACSKCGCRVP